MRSILETVAGFLLMALAAAPLLANSAPADPDRISDPPIYYVIVLQLCGKDVGVSIVGPGQMPGGFTHMVITGSEQQMQKGKDHLIPRARDVQYSELTEANPELAKRVCDQPAHIPTDPEESGFVHTPEHSAGGGWDARDTYPIPRPVSGDFY